MNSKLLLLHPQGLIAAQEKALLLHSFYLLLIIVIPVILITLFVYWRYRTSNTKAKYTPEWEHNTKLEIFWWAVPIIIIAILGTITWISTFKLDPYKPIVSKVQPITVQVVALNWRWLFIYPEQKIATINQLVFPVNTPVNFQITADGPMNAFQIPQLGSQIYAMAGMRTKLHLIADKTGEYLGYSANYSGRGFNKMRFKAHVTSTQQFHQWVSRVQQASNSLNWNQCLTLAKPTENAQVMHFSNVSPGLFKDFIAKFVSPKRYFENHSERGVQL